MNDAYVSLDDVLAAGSGRSASIVPETAGYLTLAIADAAARMPLLVDPGDIMLSVDGDVTLLSRGQVVAPGEGARALRNTLARLLSVATGSLSGLTAAARPRADAALRVDDVAQEIEAALIPINRAAARRALARLARETVRARASGALKANPRSAAPPPRSAPPPPMPAAAPARAHPSSPPRKPPSQPAPPHSSPPHSSPPPSSPPPPSPGERRLEALRAKRTRARTWVAPDFADASSLNAILAAPLSLPNTPKLPFPLRGAGVPAAPTAPSPRPFVRPLCVIPRPILRSAGAPSSELRLGPGGVGEIWAPARAVEVVGMIAEPSVSEAPPAIDSDERLERSLSFPLPAPLPDVDVAGALPPGLREASPEGAVPITDSPDISAAALSLSESGPPPSLDQADEALSGQTTGVLGGGMEVLSDEDIILDDVMAGGNDNEPLPLIDLDLLDPMDPFDVTATPTIVMPPLGEISEPTLFTETPLILRVTLPWGSVFRWEAAPSSRAPQLVAPREAAPSATPLHDIAVELDQHRSALLIEEPSIDPPAEPLPELPPSLSEGASAPLPEPLAADAPAISALMPEPFAARADLAAGVTRGVTRADELLLRFAATSDSDASVRAAAKSLRALAGVELTPSLPPLAVAPIPPKAELAPPASSSASPDELTPSDDETPPATSPAPISSPIRRVQRGSFFLSATAFAGGLAAATALVHVRPDFPDSVVALVAGILPAHGASSPAAFHRPSALTSEGHEEPSSETIDGGAP